MKTPEEARKFWVEGLRSGRFKQITGALENDGRNCCLGVACRLYMEDGGELEVFMSNNEIVSFDRERGYLPTKVMDWLGLHERDGTLRNEYISLSRMNDSGHSFEEIANVIESEDLILKD